MQRVSFSFQEKDEDKGIVTGNQQSPQFSWYLKDEPNILLNAFSRMCLIYKVRCACKIYLIYKTFLIRGEAFPWSMMIGL